IIGTTLTGPNIEWLEKNGQGVNTLEFVDIRVPARRLYGLKVSNDASLPRYTEGEVLIADPDATPITGEEVVVITKNGDEPVIKVFASKRDNQVLLESADRKQRVIRDLDEIIVIHPIIFVAKYHTIKVTI
ncbi:MAG: helix-turn-helix transcriptional regulator, partial [Yersinia sp. (in: enterobacteria)]